ncbi:u3 snoRNA associated protein [Sporothrix schenckii 1099-18]|uniref:U3 snoRNA associated protein n=1 Tax=Sporothrix schenckii 1099-18 TaxID=1397361 RepID=A0A0F2LY23_SPOSC|nr:u3 snoRNA associated protein [Sporothrix schenckii 1099-18]KJR80796.1 u3 snoRNA associated protein [Sporothrix schenckii 1099-18]
MPSAQSSPMTRSAAAKLRAKRKSGGGEDDATLGSDAPMTDAAPMQEDESPATKRRKLPVRFKEGKAATEEKKEKIAEDEEDVDEEEEDAADSDDEAPEAISTVQAAAATRHSAQKASKAADKRAADEKRKRQEKDARLKAQAGARKAREEAAAEAAAAVAAEKEEEAAAAEAQRAEEAQQPRKSVSKLLPLEFLDSDSEGEDEVQDKATTKTTTSTSTGTPAKALSKGLQATRPRKPKAHPRDRQLGTTVYRLLAETGPKTLAPKMGKAARNMKQSLQVRHRVGKPVNAGFLRR